MNIDGHHLFLFRSFVLNDPIVHITCSLYAAQQLHLHRIYETSTALASGFSRSFAYVLIAPLRLLSASFM